LLLLHGSGLLLLGIELPQLAEGAHRLFAGAHGFGNSDGRFGLRFGFVAAAFGAATLRRLGLGLSVAPLRSLCASRPFALGWWHGSLSFCASPLPAALARLVFVSRLRLHVGNRLCGSRSRRCLGRGVLSRSVSSGDARRLSVLLSGRRWLGLL
jgi:hypothetical protein